MVIISSKKIKVVIVDDNTELCKSISAFLEKKGGFEIVGIAHDGISGLQIILETQPDIAILDILLPERDGIAILEDLKNNQGFEMPLCIMLTAVSQESITKKVIELGAEYIVLKPFDIDLLVRRMIQIFDYKEKNADSKYFIEEVKVLNKEEFITETLQKVGIPFNLKGYQYLKVAIKVSIEDQRLLDSITKLLYPEVAKECSTTPSRVERDIRHAIEVAWAKGFGQNYYDIIGYKSINNEKPTNGAFISCIVERSKILKK